MEVADTAIVVAGAASVAAVVVVGLAAAVVAAGLAAAVAVVAVVALAAVVGSAVSSRRGANPSGGRAWPGDSAAHGLRHNMTA